MVKMLQVRVIKSSERNRLQQVEAKTESLKSTPHDGVRDMVATVSHWIKESQQKRLDERQICREHWGRQQVQTGA